MNLPKLKIRPISQQSVAKFGGINHHPTAPIGTWWDSRNLSSDMSPTLVAIRARSGAANIDGNTFDTRIVAMCGGEHPVFLDEKGLLHCNGHTLQLPFGSFAEHTWTAVTNDPDSWCYVGSGTDDFLHPTGPWSIIDYEGNPTAVEFSYLGATHPEHPLAWSYQMGGETRYIILDEELVPEIHWYGPYDPDELLAQGFTPKITISLNSVNARAALGADMVRMGANVIIFPRDKTVGPMWANTVKLASGATMTADDYGRLNYSAYMHSSEELPTYIKMCDIDGKEYSGVVISSTEPREEGYWLDTSGKQPALRQWSAAQTMWIQISSTFLKIYPVRLTDGNGVKLRKGDAVKLTASYIPDFTDPGLEELLNSWHYIYNVIEQEDAIVVSGLLPDDAYETTANFTIARTVPEMDYVVESGNRLWGCRYSDKAGLNEIYASALGDPANWHVFQGLSTDSWTASRGTAAPFTGAAVLDGHPLFFREESLEKVYPSASGAHQIQTFDMEGVEDGASNSLVVIENRLFYKSPHGVMVYTGSMPARISEAFGDMVFRGGSAARHRRKYCLSTSLVHADNEEPVVLVFDTTTGDWHIEADEWAGKAITVDDNLYYLRDGTILSMAESPVYGVKRWYAETAPQAIHYDSAYKSLTEHKWISYLRIRYRMLTSGTRQPNRLKVYISYDGGEWRQLKEIAGSGSARLATWEINLLPRRMDNFRLRLEGSGPVQIYDIAWRMERSEGGH